MKKKVFNDPRKLVDVWLAAIVVRCYTETYISGILKKELVSW